LLPHHAHGTYRVGSITGEPQLIVDPELDVCYEVTARQSSMTTTSNGTDAVAHLYQDANCEDFYFSIQPNNAHQGSIHESVRFTPLP
jgi:hypothetical protein